MKIWSVEDHYLYEDLRKYLSTVIFFLYFRNNTETTISLSSSLSIIYPPRLRMNGQMSNPFCIHNDCSWGLPLQVREQPARIESPQRMSFFKFNLSDLEKYNLRANHLFLSSKIAQNKTSKFSILNSLKFVIYAMYRYAQFNVFTPEVFIAF